MTAASETRAARERFETVGPGVGADPAILAALDRLHDALADASAAMDAVHGALEADGCSPTHLKGYGLARTKRELEWERGSHIQHLQSGEPERLASEDES